jgi:hypothetical protein
MKATLFRRIVAALGFGLAAIATLAQDRPPTTEQLGKDPSARRQEAEQQKAQQREQQQRNDQQQSDQQWDDTVRQQRSRAAADAAQGQAVLRTWQQRPPLAPEQNPLLGRWESLGVGQRAATPGVSPEMAKLAGALLGGITGGMCDSMLGRGQVEFRPTAVIAISHDGREQTMYRAQYRGGESRVVVLPQGGTSFTHMIVDFSDPDHATVAAVGCALKRSGNAKSAAANTAPAEANNPSSEKWVLLGTTEANGGMDVYVAQSSIRRSGASAQMSDLWDFKSAHVFEGKSFLSARNRYEYDCAGARRRMLSTTGFSGHMGQGAVVASGNSTLAWQKVPPGGPIHDYWTTACKKS